MKLSLMMIPLLALSACDPAAQTSPIGVEPLALVVYTDFECPYCRVGADRIRSLTAAHPGEIRVVLKHRPLPIHTEARGAALAAIAAEEQGRLWEYHDVLFANQKKLDQESLERYALEVGLDLERFRRVQASSAAEARLLADEAEAEALGVTGTPTFFLNGRRIQGAQPIETFEQTFQVERSLPRRAAPVDGTRACGAHPDC